MRIKRLSLLAYGSFTDRELVFADPGGLDVVYGANEAGKSTSLRAVAGALFGIDVHTKDAYRHDMADLRIGALLVGEGDDSFAFVRRKGKRGNTLLDTSGKPLDESLLARWLGGATRELFLGTYGLDHVRLREGAEALLAGKGDLGETLFGASLGSVSLHALRKQVDDEADAIYVPRGKVLPLNEALRELADKKRKLGDDATSPEVYETQRRAIAEHTAESESLSKRCAELVREKARLQQLEQLLPQLEEARERLRTKESDERAHAERRADIVFDATFATMSETMQSVRERLSEQRKAAVELPEARGALSQVELEVADALRAVGRAGDPESLLLDDATQAEIAELSEESRKLDDREDRAREALRGAMARLAAATEMPIARELDTTALEAALLMSREAGDLGTSIAKLRARIARAEASMDAKLAVLGGRAALGIEPPSVESVLTNERATAEAKERLAAQKASAHELEDELTATNLSIRRLEAQGVPPSPADVVRARAERDAAWSALREARGDAKKKAEGAFVECMRGADETVDLLLRESKRAATHAQLLLEREAATERLLNTRRAEKDASATLAALEEEWRELSRDLGTMTHERARVWIKTRGDALAEAEALADTRDEVAAMEQRAAMLTRALLDALTPFSVECDAELARVRAVAERVLARAVEEKAAIRDAKRARHDAEESVRAEREKVTALEETRERWRAPWRKLLVRLGLAPDASQKAAEASLAAHHRLAAALSARSIHQRRVADLERTTTDLEAIMRDVLRTHAPDLSDLPTLEAAQELVKRATANDAAVAEAARLDDKLAELRASIARERTNVSKLEESVREASVGLPDPTLLGARLRSNEIEPEIEELEQRIKNIDYGIGGMQRAMRDNMSASLAAATANEVEETVAKVESLAVRYARLKLASAVLTREIEAFREKNQGPILERASEHFVFLTRGNYSGLRAGYGANDEPVLRAVQGKTDVGVEALSDGARDALYLALRLGSWQHLAKTNVSLPIVLDDVLVHIDEDRTTAALVRLGEVAREMQVIVFTHQRRVVELAREALGARAHVSELATAAPLAASNL